MKKKTQAKTLKPQDIGDRLGWILFTIVCLIGIVIRLNFIDIPFERDEGLYAYYGMLSISGGTPYIDFYEMKPPGLYYGYGMIVALFGTSIEGLHLGFMCLIAVSSLFVFLIAKQLLGNLPAVYASFAFTLLVMSKQMNGFAIQAEHLLMFFAIPGVYCSLVYLDKRNLAILFCSGLLTALAFSVKQNGLFFILFAGLTPLLIHARNLKDLFLAWISFSAGVLTIFVAFFAILAAQGAVSDFLYWTFEFPKNYIGEYTADMALYAFKKFGSRILADSPYLFAAAFAGLSIGNLILKDKRVLFFSTGFLLLSFLAITPSLKFYGHYWLKMAPAIAIAGAILIKAAQQIKLASLRPYALFLACAILLLPVSANMIAHSGYYFSPDHHKILREVYTMNPFPETKVIGDLLNKEMQADDRLVVLGSELQLYLYTNKKAQSRHAYLAHLMSKSPYAGEWQRELATTLEAAPPEYAVMYKMNVSWKVAEHSDPYLMDWLKSFVADNYRIHGVADILPDDKGGSVYKWGQEAREYKTRSSAQVYVLKRSDLFK